MQVTEAAANLLKDVIAESDAPEGTAVRLEIRTDRPGELGIAFRSEPEMGDEIIEQAGMQVFVAPEISETLADRTLDIEPTAEGVTLTLR